jgi:hypothetical protein
MIVFLNGHFLHTLITPEDGTIEIRDSIPNQGRLEFVGRKLRLVLKAREVAAGLPEFTAWKVVTPPWPRQEGPDCAIFALAARAERRLNKPSGTLAKVSPGTVRSHLREVLYGDGSIRAWGIPPRAPPPPPLPPKTPARTTSARVIITDDQPPEVGGPRPQSQQ